MNAPIETAAGAAYCAPMSSLLLRLMALIAVLLLPLGMSEAPAAAQHEHAAASMEMQHCPDRGSKSGSAPGFAVCTMACSAALPAADLPNGPLAPRFAAPAMLLMPHVLHGLHPDTATPPPRFA